MESLSSKERKLLKKHPRNMMNHEDYIEVTSVINRYDRKMLQVTHYMVHLYVTDCTIPLQDALNLASKKYEVTSEEIVEYLRNLLLAPYLNNQKRAIAIHSKIFNRHFATLEEAQEGLKEYLENPALLLQHLAYYSSFHLSSIENFLSFTLKLPKQSIIFEVASESITLLCLCPNLTLNSLTHLLTYRIGSCHSDICEALNSTIDNTFCARVKEYLKGFGLKPENTIFQLCQFKANKIRLANSPMQF